MVLSWLLINGNDRELPKANVSPTSACSPVVANLALQFHPEGWNLKKATCDPPTLQRSISSQGRKQHFQVVSGQGGLSAVRWKALGTAHFSRLLTALFRPRKRMYANLCVPKGTIGHLKTVWSYPTMSKILRVKTKPPSTSYCSVLLAALNLWQSCSSLRGSSSKSC